ncbi:hypothetical protein H696_05440 [Fonticula alba]|uniref:Uncharacterized protein n=1 Tax=Fonticula alba TaxID=691883 RepID=A0A058Z1K5_FONAL|nr:hypothetical protein H696_05440 [Fonticula alba]KCV67981.1 hypothetical protein H696_05440 [Fonticula alba]|eukprot:XP_009497548.1 hypothetical protein H696_05440 [Fonticula alba]
MRAPRRRATRAPLGREAGRRLATSRPYGPAKAAPEMHAGLGHQRPGEPGRPSPVRAAWLHAPRAGQHPARRPGRDAKTAAAHAADLGAAPFTFTPPPPYAHPRAPLAPIAKNPGADGCGWGQVRWRGWRHWRPAGSLPAGHAPAALPASEGMVVLLRPLPRGLSGQVARPGPGGALELTQPARHHNAPRPRPVPGPGLWSAAGPTADSVSTCQPTAPPGGVEWARPGGNAAAAAGAPPPGGRRTHGLVPGLGAGARGPRRCACRGPAARHQSAHRRPAWSAPVAPRAPAGGPGVVPSKQPTADALRPLG